MIVDFLDSSINQTTLSLPEHNNWSVLHEDHIILHHLFHFRWLKRSE